MIFLKSWATRHGVSDAALYELQQVMSGVVTDPQNLKGLRLGGPSEAAVSNDVRLEAGRVGVRLFRNNVGACEDKSGRIIRYGLCNESKDMNKRVKSSDLIGIKPVLITDSMVGSTIGQFVARETKKRNWTFSPNDERANAQLTFMNLIVSLGGDACFASEVGTFEG